VSALAQRQPEWLQERVKRGPPETPGVAKIEAGELLLSRTPSACRGSGEPIEAWCHPMFSYFAT
jgi:hypothetical protein